MELAHRRRARMTPLSGLPVDRAIQVLIVDDDRVRAWQLEDILATWGVEVAIVTHWREVGITRIPDLVVLDGDARDWQLIAYSAGMYGLLGTPMVVVSHLPSTDSRIEELVRCGCTFLPAPVDADQLLKCLVRW